MSTHIPVYPGSSEGRSTPPAEPSWIKMSERKPTEADFPIFAYFPEGNFIEPFKDAFCFSIRSCNVRHWQKSDIPAPPVSEQQKADDAECELAWNSIKIPSTHLGVFVAGFEAALAYERAEVLKMLETSGHHAFVALMKARCTPAK